MKKVLVVGSKGMAGHMVRQFLINSSFYHVIDISRTDKDITSTYTLDLSQLSVLEDILDSENPDIVVNCAGILNDAAETNPERSVFINSYIPHFLASHSNKLIHISTDCVFSGLSGDYLENDRTDGQGFYAKSKSLGEVVYGPHLTLRTSIIGPELKSDGKGLLHWFLKQRGEVKGYSKTFWSGVTTLQLAKGILEMIEKPEVTGLVHYTNNKKISKLELLKLIASEYKSDAAIVPYENYQADKSLINTRNDLQTSIPSYEIMIKELADFMEGRRSSLYGQYYTT